MERAVQTYHYPPVTQQMIDEIVEKITAVGSPLKILMFGSRARGDHRPDSDLDLFLIEESELPSHKRAPKYYVALKDIPIPVEVIVKTPCEVHDWSNVRSAFTTTAIREGKMLYEKLPRSSGKLVSQS